MKIGIKMPQKKPKPKEHYIQLMDKTMDIRASTIMPQNENLQFLHPKAIEIPNIVVKRKKIILENMSSAVVKKPINFVGIALILLFGGLGVGIGLGVVWDNMIEPWIDKNVEIQAKVQRGELPPDTKPPSLFDFKLPIPGISR